MAAMSSRALIWFRRDLRLGDNPAWTSACTRDKVSALVVLEPTLLAAAGPYRRRAYLSAVAGLEQTLLSRGGGLRVLEGNPAREVPKVAAEVGAEVVVVNSDVTRWSKQRDNLVKSRLDIPMETHWGTLVHPPRSVLTAAGRLSRVFTAFYRRWMAKPLDIEAPPQQTEILAPPPGTALADAYGPDLPPAWTERHAWDRLERWLPEADQYPENRDFPARDATSKLSAELRFGLLSPRAVMESVGDHTPGRAAYVRQLAWRDWFAHLTFENPDIDQKSLRPEFDQIRWTSGPDADSDFEAWRTGRTGFPIVDAPMRELAATGRMHNRLRMITASFLIKDLLIDWRRGERWFRKMLIDGDLPQNCGNWQWVAGVGPDAAPYFRIFNPIKQSHRFDPNGHYLRKWLPELALLDNRAIHAPWEANPSTLAAADIVLGTTYPRPIVDHAEARKATLHAYRNALPHRPPRRT